MRNYSEVPFVIRIRRGCAERCVPLYFFLITQYRASSTAPNNKRQGLCDWVMLLATREQSTIRLIPSVCRAFGSLRDKEHKRDAMIERTVRGAPRSKVFLPLLWYGCRQFSLLSKGFLCTFYADRKYQRSLRIGRFLNAKHSWYFWGVRDSLGGAKRLAVFLTCRSDIPPLFPKILTLALLKT